MPLGSSTVAGSTLNLMRGVQRSVGACCKGVQLITSTASTPLYSALGIYSKYAFPTSTCSCAQSVIVNTVGLHAAMVAHSAIEQSVISGRTSML